MSRVNDALARAGRQESGGTPASDLDTFSSEDARVGKVAYISPLADGQAEHRAVAEAHDNAIRNRRATGLLDRIDTRSNHKLVIGQMPPVSLEQYRRLAATLHREQEARPLKVVLITSAVPGEGKTLTACNLALTLSQAYKKHVLLVDADLRRPSVHQMLGLPNDRGLADSALPGERVTAHQVTDTIVVVTAGVASTSPMEVLASGRLKSVLEDASSSFDWIIIDSPPVALLADASLLTAIADTALLIVRAGETPYTLVQHAVSALGRDKILGIVLNGASPSSLQAQYGAEYAYGVYARRETRNA